METHITVRGYHTDMYQHVNNARYLEFLEEARWQMFEAHMDMEAFMAQGYLSFVVNINISYRSQARVNDILIIQSGLKKIGNTSAVLGQQIVNRSTGRRCVDADVTFVISNGQGTPVKMEGEVRDALSRLPKFEGLQP